MSNFSTFFPAGGGGEGAGINSYAPFKVAATGNPVGYNATTGLYTNPVNDSIWIKTGNTTLSSYATYPNATGEAGFFTIGNITATAPSFPSQGTISSNAAGTQSFLMDIQGASGAQMLFILGTPGGAGTTWSITNSFNIGDAGTSPLNHIRRIYMNAGYDASTNILWLVGTPAGGGGVGLIGINPTNGSVAVAFNSSYVGWISTTQATFNPNTGYSYYIQAGTGVVTVINMATNTIIQTITISSTTFEGIFYDNVKNGYWINQTSSNNWGFHDSTMTIDTSVANIPGINQAGLVLNNGLYYSTIGGSAATIPIYQESIAFGDSVAKTSAMGDAQPLFIKLK